MTKQSKLVSILSAMALILGMGLLTSCGGGDANSIVGYWKLTSISGEDGIDEATLKGLEEDGFTIGFEATEDGKAILDFMGETAEGTWAGKDGSFTVTIDEDKVDAKVDGTTLTLSDADQEMVFEKAEKKAASTQSGESEDSEAVDADTTDDTDSSTPESRPAIVGTWTLVEVPGDDEMDAETIASLAEMDMLITLDASADGAVTLDYMGEEAAGQWSEDGTGFAVDINDTKANVTIADSRLTLDDGETVMVFERSGAGSASADTGDTSATPAESSGEYPSFGETVTLPSGIELTVSKPAEYKLSGDWLEESYPPEAGPLLVFDVVVKNGTAEEIDAWSITTRVVSDGQEATEIYDSSGGVSIPSATILPGKSLKYKVAFQVVDADDLQFTWDIYSTDDAKVHYLTN